MADVRTLLQREREARRIHHPHLSYSKSGALTCVVCNLNVKSEALWEGHLKSANHRKNLRDAATSPSAAGNGKKRKIEAMIGEENPRKRKTVDEENEGAGEGEGRKKRQVSFQIDEPSIEGTQEVQQPQPDVLPGFIRPEATAPQPTPTPSPTPNSRPPINEDEWAAFEAEIAPLALAHEQAADYANATISAAPISATEIAAQQAASSGRSRRDEEAEDEKEESEQRLADEFDVMEEMEERVRRLKEKREALRVNADVNTTPAPVGGTQMDEARKPPESESESDDDDDDDDGNDWFL